jgi:transcriptional regulator with GAF, ATPase, and Fis domain
MMTKSATTKSSRGGRAGRVGRTSKSPQFTLSADPLPKWREAKANLERWMLKEALTRTDGNMAAASRLLGITKVAVLHAVRRHDLEAFTRSREA